MYVIVPLNITVNDILSVCYTLVVVVVAVVVVLALIVIRINVILVAVNVVVSPEIHSTIAIVIYWHDDSLV